jgi:hypothetical protein
MKPTSMRVCSGHFARAVMRPVPSRRRMDPAGSGSPLRTSPFVV